MRFRLWKVREIALRYPNSFKVREKYRVGEHSAPGRHMQCGARGDSIGEVVFKAPVGGIGAEEIHS